MGEEDIFSPQDREDEEQAPGKHEKDQNAKADTKEEREGRMNILQSHEGDIPEEENEKEEDQTGEDQQPDEDPLLGSNLQDNLQLYCGMRIAECGMKKNWQIFRNPQSEIGNLLSKNRARRDGMSR